VPVSLSLVRTGVFLGTLDAVEGAFFRGGLQVLEVVFELASSAVKKYAVRNTTDDAIAPSRKIKNTRIEDGYELSCVYMDYYRFFI